MKHAFKMIPIVCALFAFLCSSQAVAKETGKGAVMTILVSGNLDGHVEGVKG